MEFSKHRESFRRHLIENECCQTTISKYMHDLRCFELFVGERDIDKQLVLEYKQDLINRYEKSSANSMLAALNSFFRFVGWHHCIVKRFQIQREVYCDESLELTEKEYIKLLNAAKSNGNDRLYFLLQTICGTGIRVSELAFFTVEAVQRGKVIITCKGKTRTVFIVSKLKDKLLQYVRRNNISSGPVFVTKTGKSIDRSNIWREMKKLCILAKVSSKKVFPHNLRHLFARAFYKIEKDIAKLADVLGHSSIDTTRIYIVSSGIEHRRQMENMRLII